MLLIHPPKRLEKLVVTLMELRAVFDRIIALDKEMRILFVGLEGSGTTAIFNQLKLSGPFGTTIDAGASRFAYQYNNIEFVVGDVGANKKLALMAKYYTDVDGLMFVVDSTNDQTRLLEVKDELHKLLNHDELKGAPLLIYANDQHLTSATSTRAIVEALNVGSILDRDCRTQDTIGTPSQGGGLLEGLE